MKIDKLFDEICSIIQEQKNIFKEMNQNATQTFDYKRYSDLIDKYNSLEKKWVEIHKSMIIMRDKNMESMLLSLKQHYNIKE